MRPLTTVAIDVSASASGFRCGGSLSRCTRRVPPVRERWGVVVPGPGAAPGKGSVAISRGGVGGTGRRKLAFLSDLESLAAVDPAPSLAPSFFLEEWQPPPPVKTAIDAVSTRMVEVRRLVARRPA